MPRSYPDNADGCLALLTEVADPSLMGEATGFRATPDPECPGVWLCEWRRSADAWQPQVQAIVYTNDGDFETLERDSEGALIQ